MAIDDRLLRIRRDYAASRAVEKVTTTCTERGIGMERRKVAREAVRIITLDYDNRVISLLFQGLTQRSFWGHLEWDGPAPPSHRQVGAWFRTWMIDTAT